MAQYIISPSAFKSDDIAVSLADIKRPTPQDYPNLVISEIRTIAPFCVAALLTDPRDPYTQYYAEFFSYVFSLKDADVFRADPIRVEPSRLRPAYNSEKMTLAPEVGKDSGSFRKRMDFLRYGDHFFNGKPPASITKREIYFNEILAKHPHENLAEYHGVTVDAGYVTSLVFKEYSCDLLAYTAMGRAFDIEDIVSQIEAAIKHLHKLGFVHVDVKPENVFVDEEVDPVRFVLGDFDSMHRLNEARHIKWTTGQWTDGNASDAGIAVEHLDWYGLYSIEKWLREESEYEGYLGDSDDDEDI